MLCHHAHLQGLVLHELTYIPEDDAFAVSAVSAASGRLVHAHPRQFVNLRTRVTDWEWSGSALIVSSRRRTEAGHWLAHYAAFVYASGTWWDLDGRHPPHAPVHPIACLASHLESIRLLVSPDDSDPASYLHELVLHQLSVATPPPLVASQASSASPLDDAALLDVPAEDPAPAQQAQQNAQHRRVVLLALLHRVKVDVLAGNVVERLTPVSASFIREDVLARLDRFERFTCFTRCRVGLSLSLEVRTCFPHVCERLGERVERNDFSKDAFLGVTSVESRRLVAQGRVRERRHVTDSQSL